MPNPATITKTDRGHFQVATHEGELVTYATMRAAQAHVHRHTHAQRREEARKSKAEAALAAKQEEPAPTR